MAIYQTGFHVVLPPAQAEAGIAARLARIATGDEKLTVQARRIDVVQADLGGLSKQLADAGIPALGARIAAAEQGVTRNDELLKQQAAALQEFKTSAGHRIDGVIQDLAEHRKALAELKSRLDELTGLVRALYGGTGSTKGGQKGGRAAS